MKTLEQILSYTKLNGECLEWVRCFNTDGYPRMVWKGNSNGKVHRIVLELSGQDTNGLVVRHTCDNIKCINPEHLVLGSVLDNVKDMDDRDRRYRVIKEETASAVVALWNAGGHNKLQIAKLLNIDPRRVGEIIAGKRDQQGRIVKSL